MRRGDVRGDRLFPFRPPVTRRFSASPISPANFTGVFCSRPNSLEDLTTGFFLTPDDTSGSYAIILHNVRTYRSAGVVAVVRGKQKAELALKKFEDARSSSDYHEGWRYFIEKTEMAAGTDPTEATHRRQAALELRESSAPPEPDDRSRNS